MGLTDADLEPLLQAVPAYASAWTEERQRGFAAGADPKPSLAYWLFDGLAFHLSEHAAAGDFSEFSAMFAALDRLYRDGETADDMGTVLTTGFLESLIYSLEGRGMNAAFIEPYISGANARAEWDAAYAYIHADDKTL